ncbi:hypothetical protein H0H81_007244 [Sphagnurus paluster]|uniref:SPX domain-containing protein n=1 Tax=Sphagnurus paluster TaxID=117069 RepID=A0A9P7KIN9_9AGAR|nr:hypothetical protein H0H81_007244 [Sphagnurus paluster]
MPPSEPNYEEYDGKVGRIRASGTGGMDPDRSVTPEWKRAYIDYRGLKKRITAIRKHQAGIEQDPSSSEPEDYRAVQKPESGQPQATSNQQPLGEFATLPGSHASPTISSPSLLTNLDASGSLRADSMEPAAATRTQPIPHHRPNALSPVVLQTSPSSRPRTADSMESNTGISVSGTPITPHQPRLSGMSVTPSAGRRPSFVTSVRRAFREIEYPSNVIEDGDDRDSISEAQHDGQSPRARAASVASSEFPALLEDAAEAVSATRIEGPFSSASSVHGPSKHGRTSNATPATRGRRPSFALYPRSLASLHRGLKSNTAGSGHSRALSDPIEPMPLKELLPLLNTYERAFFAELDGQLEKIETFYIAREAEMLARTHLLHVQLEELADHKKLVQAANAHTSITWTSAIMIHFQDKLRLKKSTRHSHNDISMKLNPGSGSKRESFRSEKEKGKEKKKAKFEGEMEPQAQLGVNGRVAGLSTDPEDYLHAKKKLKKAVLEHYRLSLLQLTGIQILNLTGFRKALKKFEKITKIQSQRQYVEEKVNHSAFASDKKIRDMMSDMQSLYAMWFARGDKKRAMTRLRTGYASKSHHYSVFRSGLLLGLAFPALISGLYESAF